MSDGKATCSFLFEQSCLKATGLQDEVFKQFPNCECEKEQVSSFSPGPVQDDELLTKLIIHPIHYQSETGEIHPLAFNDATTLDLSLFREEAATDEEIQLAIDEIKATGQSKDPVQNRIVQLVMQARAADIRAEFFQDPSERMFAVYDTAVPDKPAHASVFTPPSARKGARQRQARRRLLEIFSARRVNLDNYRPLAF